MSTLAAVIIGFSFIIVSLVICGTFLLFAKMKYQKEFEGVDSPSKPKPEPSKTPASTPTVPVAPATPVSDPAVAPAAPTPVTPSDSTPKEGSKLPPKAKWSNSKKAFVAAAYLVGTILVLAMIFVICVAGKLILSGKQVAEKVVTAPPSSTHVGFGLDWWWWLIILAVVVLVFFALRSFFSSAVGNEKKKTIVAGGFWGFSVNLIDVLGSVFKWIIIASLIFSVGVPLVKYLFGPAEPQKITIVETGPQPTKATYVSMKAGQEMTFPCKDPVDPRRMIQLRTKAPSFMISLDGGEWQIVTQTHAPMWPDHAENVCFKATEDLAMWYYYSATPGGSPGK